MRRDECREVLSRLDILEERFDHVDERFDDRPTETETRVNDRSAQRRDPLDRMNDRIVSMTRWILGLIALFGTMITVLLAVSQFGG